MQPEAPASAPQQPAVIFVPTKRCGLCRACLNPQWKQRCERNAAAAAAAGLPPTKKRAKPAPAPAAPRPTALAGVVWPQRPRRPRNAFLLFAESFHRSYRASNPSAIFAEVAEATGKAWKAAGADVRAPLEAEAATLAGQHAAELAAFNSRVAELVAAGHAPPAQLSSPAKGGSKAKKRRQSATAGSDGGDESESDGGGGVSAERWEECAHCARWVVVAFSGHEGTGEPTCAECSRPIVLTEVGPDGGAQLESWVQCDSCGKWRSLSKGALRMLAAQGEGAAWTCAMRRPGATCKSGADEWGSVRGKVAKGAHGAGAAAAAGAAGLSLAARCAQPPSDGAQRTRLTWTLAGEEGASAAPSSGSTGLMHGAPCGGVRPATRCEFVPGRDELLPLPLLAAGVDAFDSRVRGDEPGAASEPLLWTQAVPLETLLLAQPFVTAAIAAFYAGRLPELRDGRESSGPVDVQAFLAEPRHGEAVEAALFRRKQRLAAAHAQAVAAAAASGAPPPPPEPQRTRYSELNFVVHVKHNQRAVYIGEESDLTANGNGVMAFNKSWKGNPIRSWSGGMKMADMPGAQPNKLVQSRLSSLLGEVEPHLLALAEQLWVSFAARSPAAAARQLDYLAGPRRASQLGATGWNAYSFNLDYPTAAHYDCKNVGGSYSALAVLETGAPFAGSLYLVPQYRVALELRQGVVLFHRSGDAEAGLHANSGLHLPEPASHRVALVLYLTNVSQAAAAACEGRPPAEAEAVAGAADGEREREAAEAAAAETETETAI